MDLFLLGEVGQGHRISDVEVFQFRFPGGAGVAGRHVDLLQAGGLGQLPGQGVLAAAGTDDEEFHCLSFALLRYCTGYCTNALGGAARLPRHAINGGSGGRR